MEPTNSGFGPDMLPLLAGRLRALAQFLDDKASSAPPGVFVSVPSRCPVFIPCASAAQFDAVSEWVGGTLRVDSESREFMARERTLDGIGVRIIVRRDDLEPPATTEQNRAGIAAALSALSDRAAS